MSPVTIDATSQIIASTKIILLVDVLVRMTNRWTMIRQISNYEVLLRWKASKQSMHEIEQLSAIVDRIRTSKK